MADPNIELLVQMAEALGDLRQRLVFVGGCATGLLITDPAAAPARATRDVDAVAAIATLREYQALGDLLRSKGFAQTLEAGDPPFRWTVAGMKLDLMPADQAVLGFANRWYPLALASATELTLAGKLTIRLVSPSCFIATKLEAFEDRGRGDYLASHDLEDILSVVDGRPEMVDEMHTAADEIRQFVARTFKRLLADDGFLNALPGLTLEGSPAGRAEIVLARLRAIADMAENS